MSLHIIQGIGCLAPTQRSLRLEGHEEALQSKPL